MAEITITGGADNFVSSGIITVVTGPPSQLVIETAADGGGTPITDVTARSITFDDDSLGNFTASLVLQGNTESANLTFDTDSTTEPAMFNVSENYSGNITFGFFGATEAGRGVIVLADDLQIAHEGFGTLIFNGDITEVDGPKNVTLTGFGTVDFQGSNSFTGATSVNQGVLRINGSSIAGDFVIDGGIVEVEETEYVNSLQLGSGPVLTSGTYSAETDPDFFDGLGEVIVGPEPGPVTIDITSIAKNGDTVTIEYESSGGAVDVYRSSDLQDFGEAPYAFEVEDGTFAVTAATADKFFYVIVSALQLFP